MNDPVVERIRRNPKYQELKTKRGSFSWILSIIMLVLYFGFIALIAFDKELHVRWATPLPPWASRSGFL